MTDPLEFRAYQPSDIHTALAIAREAWPKDAAILPPAFFQAELELYRSFSTWTEVAVVSGNTVGFLFGQIDSQMNFLSNLKARLRPFWHLIKVGLGVYGILPQHLTLVWKYLVTEIRDTQNTPDADAEITLLMVDPEHQGKHIGTRLVDRFLVDAANLGARKTRVCTDESSNWRFYEHYGFKRYSEFFDDLDSLIQKKTIRAFYFLINRENEVS